MLDPRSRHSHVPTAEPSAGTKPLWSGERRDADRGASRSKRGTLP